MTQVALLGDISKITDGSHFSPASTLSGYPMASVKDMDDYGFNIESCRKISAKDYEKLVKNGCRPEKNDVLVAKDGSFLKHMFVSDGIDDIVLLSSIAIIKPDIKIINPYYLCYYIQNKRDNDDMSQYVSGAAIPRIILKSFARMPIELPSLNDQEQIVDILRVIDEKIELNRKMNETLERMGQVLFRHYFIDNPEAEGCGKTKLENLCSKVTSGGTPPTSHDDYYGGDIAWFSTKELQDSFVFNSEKTITEDGLLKSSAKLFPVNTVLMAIYAAPTVGRLGILTKEASFNQAACGLVAKPEIGYEFIYLCLLTSRNELNNLANGAAQQNISVGKVRDFKVMNPDKKSLDNFRRVIEPIFIKLKYNSEEIQTLTTLRDTLLPRLISGKIKL